MKPYSHLPVRPLQERNQRIRHSLFNEPSVSASDKPFKGKRKVIVNMFNRHTFIKLNAPKSRKHNVYVIC